jgi:hypothetical protein
LTKNQSLHEEDSELEELEELLELEECTESVASESTLFSLSFLLDLALAAVVCLGVAFRLGRGFFAGLPLQELEKPSRLTGTLEPEALEGSAGVDSGSAVSSQGLAVFLDLACLGRFGSLFCATSAKEVESKFAATCCRRA